MGKIVEFPGKPISSKNLLAEKIESNQCDNTHKLDFTCVCCKNRTQFELTNAVFKQLELFCNKCGTGWKVTNPVFAHKKARSN